jgi:hypothetical protein
LGFEDKKVRLSVQEDGFYTRGGVGIASSEKERKKKGKEPTLYLIFLGSLTESENLSRSWGFGYAFAPSAVASPGCDIWAGS